MMTYLKFTSKAFQRSLAYKLEYYVGLLNAFLYIFIFTSVWKNVSKESPSFLGDWNENLLIQYAIVSTLIKVSFGRNESILVTKIKNGDIIYDILKPYNFALMYYFDSLGISLFQLFARTIPLLIFSLLFFGIVPNFSFESFILFIPLYIMSFVLYVSYGFLISSLAFFFTEVFSFMILFSALLALLSGSVLPIDLLPTAMMNFANWTPFPYLFYYPTATLIQSNIPFSYDTLLIRYAIQLIAIFIVCGIVYSNGKRKLELAGG